ncbi:hypothetical protein FRC0431_00371 [Corynebacterium diphtheriae]|nr:hypothetical protein FRC0431_00371 [Corynebacterium diphtheriae]
MNTTPLVIGAYAALPATRADQETFYDRLHTDLGATGLELPFRDSIHDDPAWLASQLAGRFTDSIITAIPGTMMRVWDGGTFGLASPDDDARNAAIAFTRSIIDSARALDDVAGHRVIAGIHIHSAPSVTANRDQFLRSLSELLEGMDNDDPRLIIEHCDRYNEAVTGEKRFLSIEREIAIAKETGIGITVNWGRSAMEAYDAQLPAQHIQALVAEGVFEGVMFSGAGDKENTFGAAWADLHLPHHVDEPASLMDDDRIAECLSAAGGAQKYHGAKIQAPSEADVATRVTMLGHITRHLR